MYKYPKKYLYIILISQLLLCIATSFAIFFFARHIAFHYDKNFSDFTLKVLTEPLQDTVQKSVIHLDSNTAIAKKEVENMMDLLIELLPEPQDDPDFLKTKNIVKNLAKTKYGAPIRVVFVDAKSRTTNISSKCQPTCTENSQSSISIDHFLNNLILHRSIQFNDGIIHLISHQEDINQIVKKDFYHEIHSYPYRDNEYLWVNEILNYSGGDAYAIRLIHPNLPETEGSYLSTNAADIKGNLPYLTELTGIINHGEITHDYYFKSRTSSEIIHKRSYAKLYKPFNWIIATGKPIADMLILPQEYSNSNHKIIANSLWFCLFAAIIFSLIGISLIINFHRNYTKDVALYIKTETELDALTGAFSRKAGQSALETAFKVSQTLSCSKLIMMIDIDNFKKINDTYGHDIGDLVLKKISQTILANIRVQDALIRWGGEEFVLVIDCLDIKNSYEIAQKLLTYVNSIIFESNNSCFKTTISIGISHVYNSDDSYTQVLKRADLALYQSKNSGKNKYTIYEYI